MENATEEEPTEFLEPVVDIVETEQVEEEEIVEHEEVLEEIVHGDEVIYDADGRLVQYENVMMYEDGAEVIEEYVEVEDLGNGEYAYVVTDEHGNRRLLKPEEVEAVKKEMPVLMEEELVEQKTIPQDTVGPSSSTGYATHKRGRFPGKTQEKRSRTVRELLKPPAEMMYSNYYHGSSNKQINDMAKVDVEKYVPTVTVNRRPLPDPSDFPKKAIRNRKHPPWQEDVSQNAGTSGRRTPSPVKEPMFPIDEDDMTIRFKCPECDDGFATMQRVCDHMMKNHDCHTTVRDVEFFNDREFENFLVKIERTMGKDEKMIRKKSRVNNSQIFVCNYMTRGRQKHPELVEASMANLAERPIEVCTAFVQKTHSYECIRVKYCDQHIHFDGNIGYRVPINVKRRLYEMAFKRLPIPCMQMLLSHEAVQLLPHPTKFEEKLKNFSHVEIVELLAIISASLRKQHGEDQPVNKGKRVAIKFDTVAGDEGQPLLVVKRLIPPKKAVETRSFGDRNSEESNAEKTISQEPSFSVDGQEVPMMAREEEVLEEEEDDPEALEGCDGVMDENTLYDPDNNRDPLFDEMTEVELGVLDVYERDIGIRLNEEQKKERIRQKAKFSLSKVMNLYQQLDSATHGQTSTDMHTDTINQLREMASFVVELVCDLDAEVKAQFNPSLCVEEIRRDMIAGIAMQERVYQPDRRRRSANNGPPHIQSPQKPSMRRQTEDYSETVYKPKPVQSGRALGINMSGTFELSPEHRHMQILRQNRNSSLDHLGNEEKPSTSSIIVSTLAHSRSIPWTKPTKRRSMADQSMLAKKRGRPGKRDEVVPRENTLEDIVTESMSIETKHISKFGDEVFGDEPTPAAVLEVVASMSPSVRAAEAAEAAAALAAIEKAAEQEKKPVELQKKSEDVQSSESTTPIVSSTTKTRTGRVVKPKKWGDE